MMPNDWISCNDRLPEIGKRVEVKGEHTLGDCMPPISCREERHNFPWRWESTEWRGQVAITHWRPILKVDLSKLEA